MDFYLHLIYLTFLAIFLFVLPGFAILRIFFSKHTFSLGEWIGLSCGISLSLYPILALWFYTVGLDSIPIIAWVPGLLGFVVVLWSYRSNSLGFESCIAIRRMLFFQRHNIIWVIVVLSIVYARFLNIDQMVAPAWGDSVHHTTIVQLMIDHNGLFQSWVPYAPMQTFTYHFGFHVVIACWSWLSQMSADQSVLVGGQILNILAVCSLYPITVRLSHGNQFAGLGAIIIAGLFTQMPAYYVNWGRYTQLTAQVILPSFIWLLDYWLLEKLKPRFSIMFCVALVAMGLSLTHYRISVIAITAALAWIVYSCVLNRSNWGDWISRLLGLSGSGIVAGIIMLPWFRIVLQGRLMQLVGTIGSRATDSVVNQNELTVWQSLQIYYPHFLWEIALVTLLIGMWKNRHLAIPVSIWCILAFLSANPFVLGLRGTGLVTNFLLGIGTYIPISISLGWLTGWLSSYFFRYRYGSLSYGVLLVLLISSGIGYQNRIVEPFYQLVLPNDIRVFSWIKTNIATDARFLVNGFLAFNDSVVVGSDAGWWLPYFTQRESTMPPILYSTEALPIQIESLTFKQILLTVQSSKGNPDQLHKILCVAGITHVFLGQLQGVGGFGAKALIPKIWLQKNPDFHLLHQEKKAQVWEFDRSKCNANAQK